MRKIVGLVGLVAILFIATAWAGVVSATTTSWDDNEDWKMVEDYLMFSAIFTLIIALIFLVIWIIVTILVYKDAKRRGSQHPGLWALLVLFTGIIGLIIWFVLRPKNI